MSPALTSAPASTKHSTTVRWPSEAASIRGVWLLCHTSTTANAAPALANTFVHATRDHMKHKNLRCSGVHIRACCHQQLDHGNVTGVSSERQSNRCALKRPTGSRMSNNKEVSATVPTTNKHWYTFRLSFVSGDLQIRYSTIACCAVAVAVARLVHPCYTHPSTTQWIVTGL